MKITEYQVQDVVTGVCTCKHCGTNTGDKEHNNGNDTWLNCYINSTEFYDICTDCAIKHNLLPFPF